MTHSIPTSLRVLTRDEITRLLAAAHDHGDETWLITALATGLRRGELLALQWSDLDGEQGTLLVRRTVDSAGKVAKLKTGHRQIVLPALLLTIFEQHRLRLDAVKQAAGAAWQDHDLVFPDPRGGLLDPAHLRQSLQEMAERAGVPPFLFHALRGTTLTLLLEAGVPLPVAQAILGIHRVASPLARLSLMSLAMFREAAAKLDTTFRDVLP